MCRFWSLYVLFFALISTTYSIPLKFTNFICSPNPNLCSHNLCFIKTIRKKMTLLNYACYHPVPIRSMDCHISLKKVLNGKNDLLIIDAREDLCKILDRDGNSPFLMRVFKNFQDYGLNIKKCPLQGNVTLLNLPLDLSYFPSFVPTGNYKVEAFYADMTRNEKVINYTIYFSVNL